MKQILHFWVGVGVICLMAYFYFGKQLRQANLKLEKLQGQWQTYNKTLYNVSQEKGKINLCFQIIEDNINREPRPSSSWVRENLKKCEKLG